MRKHTPDFLFDKIYAQGNKPVKVSSRQGEKWVYAGVLPFIGEIRGGNSAANLANRIGINDIGDFVRRRTFKNFFLLYSVNSGYLIARFVLKKFPQALKMLSASE